MADAFSGLDACCCGIAGNRSGSDESDFCTIGGDAWMFWLDGNGVGGGNVGITTGVVIAGDEGVGRVVTAGDEGVRVVVAGDVADEFTDDEGGGEVTSGDDEDTSADEGDGSVTNGDEEVTIADEGVGAVTMGDDGGIVTIGEEELPTVVSIGELDTCPCVL